MNIDLRAAAPADRALLLHWQRQPHVRAAGAGGDWQWDIELARNPDWREQLIAELDGRPFGFVQIIDPAREDSHYWGAIGPDLRALDIWLGVAADLGRGYGTEIMRQALARCFAVAAVSAVLVNPLTANFRTHRFYQRLGFVAHQDRHFGDDACRVFRLEREAWESRAWPRHNETIGADQPCRFKRDAMRA